MHGRKKTSKVIKLVYILFEISYVPEVNCELTVFLVLFIKYICLSISLSFKWLFFSELYITDVNFIYSNSCTSITYSNLHHVIFPQISLQLSTLQSSQLILFLPIQHYQIKKRGNCVRHYFVLVLVYIVWQKRQWTMDTVGPRCAI